MSEKMQGDSTMPQNQQPDGAINLTNLAVSATEKPSEGYAQRPDIAFAIEVIIVKYGTSLRLYAKIELSHEDAVDEVLQQTWLALYQEGAKSGVEWLHSPTIYGWLRRVVHNIAYDYRKQPETVSLDTEEVMLKVEQRTEAFIRPDIMSMRNEIALEILDVILYTIPPQDAFIILCFHYLDYSSKDLSHRLGYSENTIKSRLRRAREKLRNALVGRGIQARDIRQIGGLNESLDQVLGRLALDAIPRDEWNDTIFDGCWKVVRTGSWTFISLDLLSEWDKDIAARYEVCGDATKPPRRLLYREISAFFLQNKKRTFESSDKPPSLPDDTTR